MNAGSGRSRAYVAAYFGIWIIAFFLLRNLFGFRAAEALAAFVVLGLLFPMLSLVATRGVVSLPHEVRKPVPEAAFLIAYLAVITVVLVWGFGAVARVEAEPSHTVLLLALKLAAFVVVPGVTLLAIGRYEIRELVPLSFEWTKFKPAVWMSLAVLIMEAFLGRGVDDLRQAHLPASVLALAAPLCFSWLVIEAGLVEEFFFRALLQERLGAVLRSPWGGLIVAAVLFGLVHAPGFYLRPVATRELLGPRPALLMAIGYSIVVTSTAGLFLGILWMRTKNFAVVIVVHAAGDLLPALVSWVRAFHLAR